MVYVCEICRVLSRSTSSAVNVPVKLERIQKLSVNESADDVNMGNNFYLASDGNWRAKNTEAGSLLQFNDGTFRFFTAPSTTADTNISWSEKVRIDNAGNVGINDTSPAYPLEVQGTVRCVGTNNLPALIVDGNSSNEGDIVVADGQILAIGHHGLTGATGQFTERLRVDTNGNLLVAHTSTHSPITNGGSGVSAMANGQLFCGSTATPLYVNREDSDGDLVVFRKDGTAVGSIAYTGNMEFGASGYAISLRPNDGANNSTNTVWSQASIKPWNNDYYDLGNGSYRWDDVYATNGTINTSDENEKQDIEALSDAEKRVATTVKGLIKKFRWKNKVTEKGDDARIHVGVVAQDLKAAFEAEGLDAGRYAMFISTTWTDDDGKEQTRMGVRYNELLAFIIGAM